MPGDWKIDVRYMNRRGIENWVADASASSSIKVSRSISGRRIKSQSGDVVLGFAEISSQLQPIRVPQW